MTYAGIGMWLIAGDNHYRLSVALTGMLLNFQSTPVPSTCCKDIEGTGRVKGDINKLQQYSVFLQLHFATKKFPSLP